MLNKLSNLPNSLKNLIIYWLTLITLEVLNSLDSLTALVTKLPYELRRRWVEKAVHIENSTGILAKFEHFVHFVQNESDKLNSLFSLRNLSVKVNKPEFKVKASFYSVSSNKPTPKKDTNPSLKPECVGFAMTPHTSYWNVRHFYVSLSKTVLPLLRVANFVLNV